MSIADRDPFTRRLVVPSCANVTVNSMSWLAAIITSEPGYVLALVSPDRGGRPPDLRRSEKETGRDLDRFKLINGSVGQRSDAALLQMAERLRGFLGARD